jgi:putative transcriptional regulator
MPISYNKLWKLCIDRQMKKCELANAVKISPSTLAKLGKNEPVSLDVLVKICQVLRCDIGDIMQVITDETSL